MTTLTGRNTRTIVGYVITLLDYPRWVIEREVDFTNCHLGGSFDADDRQCSSCHFGAACRWLNTNRAAPSPSAPLDDLLEALRTSVDFFRVSNAEPDHHAHHCECDTCRWLREAQGFLRHHRHKS
jgi:hypothetical protein